MDLLCRLSEPIGTLTNYLWRVDGRKIKDWVVSGTGTNATTAEVLFWGYDSNRTSATTQFIWTEPSSNLTVSCTVQVGGETLVAQTKFEVRRPEANWTLTPKYGQVAVTTGVCSGPLPTNYYHLTTGLECSTNDVGIYYAYEITDLKGYLESYEVSWVQLVQIDWLENFSEPPLGTAAPGGWYSAEKHTKGLDTRFPANTWGQEPKLWDHDAPRSGLWTSRKFEWRKDQFEAYLLWQAKRRPSIPVR